MKISFCSSGGLAVGAGGLQLRAVPCDKACLSQIDAVEKPFLERVFARRFSAQSRINPIGI